MRATVSQLGQHGRNALGRPDVAPSAIRFGRVELELANIKNGIPQDERLRPPHTSHVLAGPDDTQRASRRW